MYVYECELVYLVVVNYNTIIVSIYSNVCWLWEYINIYIIGCDINNNFFYIFFFITTTSKTTTTTSAHNNRTIWQSWQSSNPGNLAIWQSGNPGSNDDDK